MFSPLASETTDVLVKSSDLMWLKGNPDLRSSYDYSTIFVASYAPLQWFNVSGFFNYIKKIDANIINYSTAPVEMGGVIRHNVNASPSDMIFANIEPCISLFNNQMRIRLNGGLLYFRSTGPVSDTFNYFRTSGTVSYKLKNCSFGVSYSPMQKNLSNGGMMRYSQADSWNFDFSYGNGNLWLNLSVRDIFNKTQKSTIRLISSCYSEYSTSRNIGRSVWLTLSYTFNYGKVVKDNFKADEVDKVTTSVIK